MLFEISVKKAPGPGGVCRRRAQGKIDLNFIFSICILVEISFLMAMRIFGKSVAWVVVPGGVL